MTARSFIRYLLLVSFYSLFISVNAQKSDSLIAELGYINKAVIGNAAAISHRAMNIFLADKTGYLSERTDLSFYTNYVTLNSSTGTITVNHNFQKAAGMDEPIKKLPSVGLAVSLPVSFSNSFFDHRYDNGMGIMAGYKWLGKVKTQFADAAGNKVQKKSMDALRAAILHTVETEINKKKADFDMALWSVDTADVPGQDIAQAKQLMQQEFDDQLKEEYEEKFASLQAATLTKTNHFKLISTHWTSIQAYIPLLSPDYYVASSVHTNFEHEHGYPFQLTISHTRLWESAKAGRLFVTANADLLMNNSKLSYGLDKINLAEYTAAGGKDTLHNAALKNNKAYIGVYESFVTPTLQARFVYFPFNSHIGFSFLIQQNFGSYNVLNSKISIPVVLINSKKTPAAHFDFYVLFLDMRNKLKSATTPPSKTIIGLSVGVPLSRLMF